MKKYKCLSLDIWDTVLRRKCHPDEIKLATAKHLYLKYFNILKNKKTNVNELFEQRKAAERYLAKQSVSKGFDDEYDIVEVFRLWLTNIAVLKDYREIIDDLYIFELNREKDAVYLDSHIIAKINSIPHEKLAFISDFYAGKEFIMQLIKHVGFPFEFDYQYVSCEYNVNKKSGRLFQRYINDIKFSPEELYHLGDNVDSDVVKPSENGIKSERYIPADEHINRHNREKKYMSGNVKDLLYLNEKYLDESDTVNKISLFLCAYIIWIMEDICKKNIKKIYFFTREGEFFYKIFNILKLNNVIVDMDINPQIMEVSRLATFLPSVRELSLDEMMRIWNQYSTQSMEAFFKSLGIKINDVMVWLEKYGIEYDVEIQYPWLDERVKKMFNDSSFNRFMTEQISVKKDSFEGYLKQLDLDIDGEDDIAIVDIGWRGTIQDNIAYMMPHRHIYGYYIGLQEFLNAQPKNTTKFGFINDQIDYKMLLKFVAPMEMVMNSPNGSTVGYAGNNEDGYYAVRKKCPSEDKIYYLYTEGVQKKICDQIERISVQVALHSLESSSIKLEAYKGFKKMLLFPYKNKDLINAFFSLSHNEEFGVGKFIDKHVNLSIVLFFKALVSKAARNRLKRFLSNTSWPQGYFVKYKLNILVWLYNILLKNKCD